MALLFSIVLTAHNGLPIHTPFHLNTSFKEGVNYMGGHIIFKVKEAYRSNCTVSYINDSKLTPILNYLGVSSLAKIFPMEQAPKEKYNKMGQAYADLSLTYELLFSNQSIGIEKAINLMLATGIFEYAEPRYIRKTSVFTPNDPNANGSGTNQYNYLNQIKAYNAWDLSAGGTQGDTNVVIGIVDSGSDLAHPDLMGNIKHNYHDTIDGIDNDLDGYIDNFTGWDLAGANYNNIVGDNNPQIMGSNNIHGSHVSGDASACTNNGIGVAGVGFKCKLLIVKCAADNDTRSGGEGYIITGYEGIQYAATHGAKVINCSWGGSGSSSYEQSIITSATINHNCVVVAAAGNDGMNEISYPAGYTYVVSVGATEPNNDNKASFSNFNYTVDLCAPGDNIYNTLYSQTYTYLSGTSMATPITSGGIALVLAKYPTYTGMQAAQRVISTTDNIYTVSANAPYTNLLGTGRLNLFAAVTSAVPAQGESVVFTADSITDHNALMFTQGDTLFIGGTFVNYLNPTSSAAMANITVVAGGSYLTAINTSYALGVMGSSTSKNNHSTPFAYKIGNVPNNTAAVFQVQITDGAYTRNYFITLTLNPDYVNITINSVHTTITSNGKIGWRQDGEVGGMGFAYNNDNLLYEAGLMVGTSATAVSDCVRGTNASASDADFATVAIAQKVIPSVVSNFDVSAKINDSHASPVQNVLVHENAYAWSSIGSSKFVIVEYIIKNTGASSLTNLYAGIFADWDIDASTATNNKSNYDTGRKMGYSWSTTGTPDYAGIRLVSNTPANFYAIDNVSGGGGGVDITTSAGFTKAQKYTTLSTMRAQAGNTASTGDDVCNVMSSGPFTITSGDSIKIAFALLAGDNLADLQVQSDTAYARYNGLPLGINDIKTLQHFLVHPNPAQSTLVFSFQAAQPGSYCIALNNILGQTVKTIQANASANNFSTTTLDISDLTEGVYIYKVLSPAGTANTGKVIISR